MKMESIIMDLCMININIRNPETNFRIYKGIIISDNGEITEGHFKNNVLTGNCRKVYSNLDIYEAESSPTRSELRDMLAGEGSAHWKRRTRFSAAYERAFETGQPSRAAVTQLAFKCSL